MKRVLEKLARQLNSYDEASLMSLWEDYAEKVRDFEPTKRWEEAALIFGFIQTVRWKNQLFNYHWASGLKPKENGSSFMPSSPLSENGAPEKKSLDNSSSRSDVESGSGSNKRVKVLPFRPRETDESV